MDTKHPSAFAMSIGLAHVRQHSPDLSPPSLHSPCDIALAFCAQAQAGRSSPPTTPEALALLRKASRVEATATADGRVLVECFRRADATPRGVLQINVDDDRVVAVKAYLPG